MRPRRALKVRNAVLLILLLSGGISICPAETLQQFASEFWAWRAQEQPFGSDDIPRLDRPSNLTIDWSPRSIAAYRAQLRDFENRFEKLNDPNAPVAQQVDYRLMSSALARVHWELDINARWQRDPSFYVDQTLGALYVTLLQPPPFSEERQEAVVSRLRSFPATLQVAQRNLTDARKPFADLAIEQLTDIDKRLGLVATGLHAQLDPAHAKEFETALPAAIEALLSFRSWLAQQTIPRNDTAIGREQYLYFLRQVALLPYTPEQMLLMSRQERARTLAFAAFDSARAGTVTPLATFTSAAEQIERERADEIAVRAYMEAHHVLTIPPWVKHYRNLVVPGYVAPLEEMGPADDLTSPGRLWENGTSYIHTPRPGPQGFFATSLDPRPIILHEGVPGHYFQKVLGFANPDPIRSHYYDSGPNEGIGFYSEEMMMQAGLFDNDPGTRQIIFNFMKLRALRVEVDVKLALGEFTMSQAVRFLTQEVPMGARTALGEVALFATTPGQAITYQIGKLQILELLADARAKQGSSFSLQRFHDSVWQNGNVPLSLQRWELLNDPRDVPALKLH